MKTREELPDLLNSKGLTGVGVEVGVCKAEFLTHLASKWNGSKLYGVDAWRYFPGLDDLNNGDNNTQLNNLAQAFMSTYSFGSKVVLIRDLSKSAADLFDDESLDFVYLDAGHDYDSVKVDLEAWYPKVKKGGILAGHDYFDGTIFFKVTGGEAVSHFSVKKAVDDFAASLNVTINKTEEQYAPTWWFEV
jgi:Methyltransferase domain